MNEQTTRKPFSRHLMLRMYRMLIERGPMDSWGLAAALWPHTQRVRFEVLGGFPD